MDLNAFMNTYKLENKATNNVKISEVINDLKIKDFNIYMKDDKLTTKCGIVNLDNKTGTHWVCYYESYYESYYFDSFGVRPPKNIENQLRPLTFSTYKIQKIDDKRCASYCLYILYLINKGKTFKEAVTKLFLFTK